MQDLGQNKEEGKPVLESFEIDSSNVKSKDETQKPGFWAGVGNFFANGWGKVKKVVAKDATKENGYLQSIGNRVLGKGTMEDLKSEENRTKGIFKALFSVAAIVVCALAGAYLLAPVLALAGVSAGLATFACVVGGMGVGSFAAKKFSAGIGKTADERSVDRIMKGLDNIELTAEQEKQKEKFQEKSQECSKSRNYKLLASTALTIGAILLAPLTGGLSLFALVPAAGLAKSAHTSHKDFKRNDKAAREVVFAAIRKNPEQFRELVHTVEGNIVKKKDMDKFRGEGLTEGAANAFVQGNTKMKKLAEALEEGKKLKEVKVDPKDIGKSGETHVSQCRGHGV